MVSHSQNEESTVTPYERFNFLCIASIKALADAWTKRSASLGHIGHRDSGACLFIWIRINKYNCAFCKQSLMYENNGDRVSSEDESFFRFV